MNTKEIEVEMLDCTGKRVTKRTISVFADIPTKFVSNEEYINYRSKYKFNKSCVPDMIIISQSFTEHCNGFAIYYNPWFERIAINSITKEYRNLTMGESWNLGDNID